MERLSKKTIYLMPGMGASPKIFENIKLGEEFNVITLDWEEPFPNEKIADYAQRIAKKITHKNAILIGVSFGGIIIQEIAKIIDCKGLVIISSIKSKSEIPFFLKISKYTYLHKLLPINILQNAVNSECLPKNKFIKLRLKLYRKYQRSNSTNYLKWCINEIINWEQEVPPKNLIHIQGTKDVIFPIKNDKGVIYVKNGTHIMIVNRCQWFNEHLPKILNKF